MLYAVSGSSSGIGRSVCELLKEQGQELITIDLKGADINADLSTEKGRSQCLLELTKKAEDGLDGLIPCAGVGGHIGQSEKVIEVNYRGATDLIEGHFLYLKNVGGVVVVIGSNSMAMPDIDERLVSLMLHNEFRQAKVRSKQFAFDPYAAGKTALCIWMRKKAVEYIKLGVRMNAVAPGMTETAMIAGQRKSSQQLAETLDDFASSAPIGHAAEPETIAGVIGFLLSEVASYIVGEVLYVDGGHAAQFRPEHV